VRRATTTTLTGISGQAIILRLAAALMFAPRFPMEVPNVHGFVSGE
jgi:hypothetical protein